MTIIETMDVSGRPAILFDVMDTLVYNPFYNEVPAFFGITHEELLRRKHPTSWIEFESGAIPESEYFRRMFTDGSGFDEDRFRACVAGAYRWVEGMEDCLADLSRAGNEIHTLSNYPPWYRTIENKLRLSRYLNWTFVSCNTGLRKPSREAFLSAANGLGRSPGNCLLIDDCERNCAGAVAAGMQAIHFHCARDLRLELVRRGLVPATPTSHGGRAFWFESAGAGSIREEILAAPPDGWCRIETEACGISPGTERLVGLGRVPAEARPAMRCQYMVGDFGFPLKYGYSLVGRCVEGPPSLLGRRVHTMHPHQDHCNVEANAVFPVPEGVPALRATLASNLETAVNAVWDSQASIGASAAVVGLGIVGSLVARLLSSIPGTELLVVETAAEKRRMAERLGFQTAESAKAGGFDLAFECSGSPEGLQTALDAVGSGGCVVALSWYGDREVVLRLGTDFHYGRKRIVSSQVSSLPGERLPRWDYRRRKELVFRLLQSPVFDQHITDVVSFEDLPPFFRNLCGGGYGGLSAAIEFRKKEG